MSAPTTRAARAAEFAKGYQQEVTHTSKADVALVDLLAAFVEQEIARLRRRQLPDLAVLRSLLPFRAEIMNRLDRATRPEPTTKGNTP